MDWIPGKLRTIRQEFNMTQLELAQASGLSQRDISQLENGRKEGLPKEYIHFLHSRGVDLNWLFADPAAEATQLAKAPGTVRKYATAEDAQPAALAEEDRTLGYGRTKPGAAQPGPSRAPGGAALEMVDEAAQVQYAARHREPGFVQGLPMLTLPLPEVQQGVFRCFQVSDTSLSPAFMAHEWLIARLEPALPEVADGGIYVVVTEKALHIQRVFRAGTKAKTLVLRTEAAGTPALEVAGRDVLELWSIQGRLSFQLPAPAAEQKVSALEANLQDLLSRVQRLEQGR